MRCAKYNLQSERTFETPCICPALESGVFKDNIDD